MIVATAGHVDHGKTSLVKQLTGIDTDRLEEEKQRGLSINLGFAYQDLGEGHTLGFIDVPGHSRFINTMIAGVNGIDLGMLVVAADDGVMPQTREHMDVLRLLGIGEFIAVITKTDRVEATRVESVAAEVAQLPGVQPGAAIFRVSNDSGEGMEALRAHLDRRAREHTQRESAGNFRLWVDRAFLLKGAGLILTGTAIAGSVSVGDSLQLLPAGSLVRVRSLHVDNQPSDRGQAGQRCALNVTGDIDRDKVARGDLLCADNQAAVTNRVDVSMELLDNAPFPLRQLSPLTLHIGAMRLQARLYLLEDSPRKQLAPGERSLAQLILERALPCCRGDRFLVRDDSESVTLGGGMVLDPFAPQSGKAKAERMQYLQAMNMASPVDALHSLLENQPTPIDIGRLLTAWNCSPDERQAIVAQVPARYFENGDAQYAISRTSWQQIKQSLLAAVQDWQLANPGDRGIRATTLQAQLQARAPGTVFRSALSDLLQLGKLLLADGFVRTPDHAPSMSGAESARWNKLATCLATRGLQLPLLSELASATGLDPGQVRRDLQAASQQGRAIKLNDNRYALPQQMAELARILIDLSDRDGKITIATYKEGIHSGRKLAIEVLEHFDASKITLRSAQHRVVLDRELPATLYTK